MASTPNQPPSNESESAYSYVQETFPGFPQLAPHSSWMNIPINSQAHYGGRYLPYVPHPRPQSILTTPTQSQNASSPTTSTNDSTTVTGTAQNATSSSENGAKGNTTTKWRDEQTTVLVREWKERIEELESSRATETWRLIADAVNKAGSQRTVQQCKNKIRNLKQAYKDAKANNKRTGSSPKTSPFFDTFDEVLGTRAVMTMPGVIQSDSFLVQASNDSAEDSDDSETDSSGTPSPDQNAKRKKLPEKPARKQKKSRVTAATALIDLTEKLVEMQRSQAEMIDKAQSRTEELILKMEMDQRKLDEESRRRDQEFFLRMAELIKK